MEKEIEKVKLEKEAAIRAVTVQRQVEPVNLELARTPVRRDNETPAAEPAPVPEPDHKEQTGTDINSIATDVYKILRRRLLHERERAFGVS